MNILFLKSLLLPLIENKDILNIDIKEAEETFSSEVRIIVSSEDIRRIIGHRGKMYRAIKILIQYGLRKESVNVIIDLWDKK
jgi:predicted RNA-binding protein YlqC (UPF0109 family)